MTTPYNISITVRDNITSESGLAVATINVVNSGGGVAPPPPASSQCLFGVYDPANDGDGAGGWNGGDGGVQQFEGAPVKVATYYVQWQEDFPTNFANLCQQKGAKCFAEMEPWFSNTSWPAFNTITTGAYDSYLTTFGQQIKAFGHQVMLTFAHEMNGSWYPWGNGGPQGVTPTQWVAAWKHVHDTINAAAGPGLIQWVWAPNNADAGSVVPYWPGESYVDIAAYDGYIQNSSQTFANFQQQTINQIKSVTNLPIWNSECGVNPTGSGQAAAITKFIGDMHNAGLSGFMWWNQDPFNVSGTQLQAVTAAVNAWNA